MFTNASDALKSPDSKAAAAALKGKASRRSLHAQRLCRRRSSEGRYRKGRQRRRRAAVAAALKGGEPIQTAIGKLTYGETGDLTSPSFSLFKWEDGKIVPVE